MTTFDSKQLRQHFRTSSLLVKLIGFNIAVFLLVRIFIVGMMLFKEDSVSILQIFMLPSSPKVLLSRPWSVITYMFMHIDLLHLIFNMLWLYWFGQIFLKVFTARNLLGCYLLGGVFGGVLYMLSYNIFPYFETIRLSSFLIGASASVMAIVFSIAFFRKDMKIRLLFIGEVRLLYLALAVFFIDLMAITSANAGGSIAHIGGALFGILFARFMNRGKDITSGFNRFIDLLVNGVKRIGNKKSKKTKYNQSFGDRTKDFEYRDQKNQEMVELDRILDKLKRSGYQSLSSSEKKQLFDAGKK